jgi:hypothetical protein
MSTLPVTGTVRRDKLTAMLRAALESGENRFARQAGLAWLAAFPGDIEVTLLQCQAVIADGRPAQALPALEMVLRKDPFCAEALRLMARACKGSDPARYLTAATGLHALGSPIRGAEIVEWGETMRQALAAFGGGRFTEAEAHVREAMCLEPDLSLAVVVRLLITRATQSVQTTAAIARHDHERLPECLPISLVLAEMLLQMGNEPEAVHLLHLCASGDAMGQTARRMWGELHPYRSLWPDDMIILFDLPIPAGVAASMGWNRLVPGELVQPISNPVEAVLTDLPGEGEKLGDDLNSLEPGSLLWLETLDPTAGSLVDGDAETTSVEPAAAAAEVSADEIPGEGAVQAEDETSTVGEQTADATPDQQQGEPKRKHHNPRKVDLDGTAQSVGSELERLAKKIKQPALGRVDGRFPIYVVLSSLTGLTEQYGPQTTSVLQNELRRLADAVHYRPGWNAIAYYPDDSACTTQFGLAPVDARDPWKVKMALHDLDVALRQRGEMIGAVLIVGGNEVIPFHRLPNPTVDDDGEVYSDSPYATLDANYFVPEWPVGRLPGEKGPDVSLLLEQLRGMQRCHNRRRKIRSLNDGWMGWVGAWLARMLPARGNHSFGYTAAVWRRSSLAVFRPIGAPHTVKTSPPEHTGSVDRGRIAGSNLGYFNLHGLEDSPSWYGQRDPMEGGEGPDYPVALSPEDLKRNGHAPRVVFSEACFGAHIVSKGEKESLALKFLSMGTQAVVGSTCTAYGSVNTPLIAADLLGNLFWQYLKSGRAAGDALMQAKIDLVREMNRRQGFLDGEDQKTLISFVLYGDPLAVYDGFRAQGKTHRMKNHLSVKTVTDQPEEGIPGTQVSGEVLKQVKGLVAEYLPGAELAEMHFAHQALPVESKGKASPERRKGAQGSGDRLVVTVSKRVQTAQHVHVHTMRVTLDESGKPIKLSMSR